MFLHGIPKNLIFFAIFNASVDVFFPTFLMQYGARLVFFSLLSSGLLVLRLIGFKLQHIFNHFNIFVKKHKISNISEFPFSGRKTAL